MSPAQPLIDTLAVSRALQVGSVFSQAQADTLARVLDDALHHGVATSADIKDLRTDLKGAETRTQADLKGLETRMQADLKGLETRMQADLKSLETRLDAKIDRVEARLESKMDALGSKIEHTQNELRAEISAKIADSQAQQTRLILTTMFAIAGLTFAVARYMK